ncbi:hypothetical protein ABNQ39_00220 (plasmid) [Azospirillum sp. A26]|uniref:hypothetical protein n=1 Tax=Azospirillum sp. A26 TaxID=3160607 RepID=UPI0036701026
MPLNKITLRPGINKQATPTLNEGGWSDSNLIRFRDGQPQTWGGWTLAASGLSGVARGIHTWSQLDGEGVAGIGTNTNLYIFRGGGYDITPSGLAAGPADAATSFGWGASTWGTETWGTPRSVPLVGQQPRTWSLANWGEFLLANPRENGIYVWQPSGATINPATLISQAPQQVRSILVGMPERHLIALGCSDPGATTNYDPLLVRFSDVEDYTVWTATATNSAGSFRLSGGSQIMAGVTATNEHLIWTDKALWSMKFAGAPYYYGFDQLGGNCGLISPHAAVDVNGTTVWMSEGSFFLYRGGAPQTLPCTEHDAVFKGMNRIQSQKIYGALNTVANEAVWFFPSSASVENDSYISWNYVENVWATGSLARTCWTDRDIFGYPLATSPEGTLYYHEFGYDADGTPIPWYLESGFFDISDGTPFTFVDRILPDQTLTGSALLTLKVADYPSSTPRSIGPYTITPTTTFITPRARGRQMAVRFESAGQAGTSWRLGAVRINSNPDGRR